MLQIQSNKRQFYWFIMIDDDTYFIKTMNYNQYYS
jgi:hypothetical protein